MSAPVDFALKATDIIQKWVPSFRIHDISQNPHSENDVVINGSLHDMEFSYIEVQNDGPMAVLLVGDMKTPMYSSRVSLEDNGWGKDQWPNTVLNLIEDLEKAKFIYRFPCLEVEQDDLGRPCYTGKMSYIIVPSHTREEALINRDFRDPNFYPLQGDRDMDLAIEDLYAAMAQTASDTPLEDDDRPFPEYVDFSFSAPRDRTKAIALTL